MSKAGRERGQSKVSPQVGGKPLLRDKVRERVVSLIESEGLKDGDRLLPEKELASRFEVSFLTVRAALKELESQGLIERRQGRGTFVKQPEVTVASHPLADRMVAVVCGVEGHLFDDLNQSVINRLQASAYMPMLLPFENKQPHVDGLLERLRELSATGCRRLVIVGWEDYLADHDELREFVLKAFPQRLLMSVFSPPLAAWNVHWVSFDLSAGYRLAVEHLKERGHQSISYLAGDMQNTYSHHRENRTITAAYTNAMITAGLAEGIRIHTFESRELPELGRVMGQHGSTALIAMNDYRAACACKAFRRMAVGVPDEVAIVGFYNTPWSEHEDLTTIDVNIPALSAAIGELMELPIEAAAQTRIVPPLLVVRAST